MSDYRRYFVPGGMGYLKVTTYNRQPILTSSHGGKFLRNAIQKVQSDLPFGLFATVLLPDHWHLILQLPEDDANYSLRLKLIKEGFTRRWLGAGLPEAVVSPAQLGKGERGIWQPRFWEHMVKDEADLERCVDYIHWNPRKHLLVARVRDYPWSSFHRFVQAGQYDFDWGGSEPEHLAGDDIWGEP